MVRSRTVANPPVAAGPAPTAREGTVLLDQTTGIPAERAIAPEAYHLVGHELLGAGIAEGRPPGVSAAVEVFRIARLRHPDDPSLSNGLGAALMEAARYASPDAAAAALTEAAASFRTALTLASRKNVPGAARLRYRGNLGLALWMAGEMLRDTARLNEAEQMLRGVAAELPEQSPHWPQVQDNLANTLMARGRAEAAITAYQAALDRSAGDAERARVLNNLGTAYAELGRHDRARETFDQALALQQRRQAPFEWARTQHNIGTTLLRQALSDTRSSQVDTLLRDAVAALEAAREERQPLRRKSEWAATTANLAAAYIGLGVALCTRKTRPDPNGGIHLIRRALALYDESMPELSGPDQDQVRRNAAIATEILQRLTATSSIVEPWPTETYSQAHRERKENIVEFLTRAWLPLISAGKVDLAGLRVRDPTAAKAIDKYTRAIDPATGERRRLPAHLHIPTKQELTDRLAAQFPTPGDRPVRLDWALRARARRERSRK
jgi:tetratricopeptide (TPR) repeat protein